MKTINHPSNPRRAARKAARRAANVTWIAARKVASMATAERELHVRLAIIAGRVRSAMIADGHSVTSATLPELITGGSHSDRASGSMGCSHGGTIKIFREAFRLAGGIQRKILVHELVHHFDALLLTGEAYARPQDGHDAYAAQRAEVLARSYESRTTEFFA